MRRRDILKAALALPAVGGALRPSPSEGAAAPGAAQGAEPTAAPQAGPASTAPQPPRFDADYIVVGSGAGGGTVAARLAEAGYSVLVLEAGADPKSADYDVPAFHPLATENEALRWDFFVQHYSDPKKAQSDPKFIAEQNGVWYPRAGTLGGCTSHNALILVYPSNSDWDQIADLTGDVSWRADNMRQYFERLENCGHRPMERLANKFGRNPSRHGYSGWLRTEKAAPAEAIRDGKVRRLIADSIRSTLDEVGLPSRARLESLGDPNDWRVVRENEFGACYTPMTTHNHERVGTRERLLSVAKERPDLLKVELNALAAKVLFDGKRAIGVEYLKGERLYQAHARPSDAPGETRRAYARREVILAGGAFNTPQLLMLSGVGPEAVLREHSIPLVQPLENVGQKLQDRYEVAVVNRMKQPWDMLRGATFTTGDRQYQDWNERREGIYTTNGALLCVISRSGPGQPSPDLFCYAVLADFRGYKPGYSKRLPENPNCLTWVVLKGHTNNTGGSVTLTSADARVRPQINFKYFDEGTDKAGEDLTAVVNGISLVRRMTEGVKKSLDMVEELPGPACSDEEQLKDYVRSHAWGHHASCSCAIGPADRGGVLSSDFKVHGTQQLRVVDASVFPRVPGLFIVSAVYMIAEKAADVIVADAKRNG
jgi:choline dehydrogenase